MKHLLFVPAPAHRDALLGEGVGGARPPVAWMPVSDFGVPCGWEVAEPVRLPNDLDRDRTALILVWDGEIAVEGCDRLTRAVNAARVAAGKRAVWRLDGGWDAEGAHSLVDDAEEAGLGTVVVED